MRYQNTPDPCFVPAVAIGLAPAVTIGFALAVAVGLAACGSSGREGSDEPSITFEASSAALAENGGPIEIAIELQAAAPLDDDVTFAVMDTRAGSASAGLDYLTIGTRNLAFPAGSTDGSRVLVTLAPVVDALVEGADETVVLRLQDSVGAAIGSSSVFTGTLIDVDKARIGFTAATTSSIDEHTGPRSIVLELDLDPGVRLGLDIDVLVADLRTGSATPGSDYASLPTFRIPFPTNATDGLVRAIAVQVLDDSASEGAETVRLGLQSPSAGAELGAEALHQLIIQDDDAPGSSTLSLSAGAVGSEVPVAYGQLVHLGSQNINAGANAGTLLRARNSGVQSLNVGLPELTGTGRGDFVVTGLGSTTGRLGRVAASSNERAFPFTTVPQAGGPGIALRYEAALAEDLAQLDTVLLHDFPVPDLGPVTLALERVPLPIEPGALAVLDGEAVAGGLRALVGEIELWSGTIADLDGSRVFLARRGRTLEGRIELPVGERRFVHVVPDRDHGPDVDARILRLVDDGSGGWPGGGDFCHSPALDATRRAALPIHAPTEPVPIVFTGCRLALETDYQFFQQFGSTGDLADYVVGLVAAVGERFSADVGTRFTISYLGLHSIPDDGWDTPDSGTSAAELLSEFKATWDAGWPAEADLAHFLSGAPLAGGAAFTASLCDDRFGYAASANLRGNLNWNLWTGESGSQTWDFVVVAHELGHNFGSLHTHDYCPPIDRCALNCEPGTQCSRGTLMSYCHLCGGGLFNIDLAFHPFTANIMRQVVNASCLTPAALQPGEVLLYSLQFAPNSATGTLDALLRLPHEATNEPRPFEIRLRGESLQ